MNPITIKQINKIKLAITTDCNLSCSYCFVKKSPDNMELSVAKNCVDLLLLSPGKRKLLSIYGGEPFLNFGIVRLLVDYAQSKARKLNKELTISVCTNFTLATKDKLRFLKERDLRLIVSLAGKRIFHDVVRASESTGGTYNLIKGNLRQLFDILPVKNIGSSFCIFPSTAGDMYDNFLHLLSLGFRYINLEIIREYKKWGNFSIKSFVSALGKIIEYIIDNAERGNFIFLNPINWQIKENLLHAESGVTCPFSYKLEVYPKGGIAFSPFLLNTKNRNKYIIGNITNNNLRRFSKCVFDPTSKKCNDCERKYFDGYGYDKRASEVYRIYHYLCLNAAEFIVYKSSVNGQCRKYLDEIKNRVCF